MGIKHRILMAQPNYAYGNNVFVPYSVGLLQAYAETIPEIRDDFHFLPPVFRREDPREIVQNAGKLSIAGFSCYLWNWEYNKLLAQNVRVAFPECFIVFGGPNVPYASEGFFAEHPYVDLLIHHEGELRFASVLQEFSSSSRPDFTSIAGLSIRVEGNRTLKTAKGERIKKEDLLKLPSPYLSGVFDHLLNSGYAMNVSQETNRGCPYSCEFCDWGENTYSKVFPIDEGRIIEEFEWFGRHKAEYLFSCDANWGMLKERDLALTEQMIAMRARHGGFPQRFRMCTAKNSTDTVFTIAKMLNDAGMNKGATLSFQSMDERTLELIKRKNIKLETFSHLMDRYRAENIITYTELIMGMPGETYESTKKGIDKLFASHADSINLNAYVCTMLPNAGLSKPAYVAANGIKSIRMPILLGHSTPESEVEDIVEYEKVVVETASMPNADWQRTYLFYWMVQAFHCLGLTQYVAILFRKYFGVEYSDFYERLITHFSADEETFIGKEIALIRGIIARSMEGGRIDLVLPQFGNIYWPLEEASFLTLVTGKEEFYRELRSFIGCLARGFGQPVDEVLLDDTIRYQASVVKDPYVGESTIRLEHDLHRYLSDLRGEEALSRSPTTLVIKAQKGYGGDLETFAREVVWYGRKGGSFRHTNISELV